MVESIPSVRQSYGGWLRIAEWVFTIIFTVEYLLRLWSSPQPVRYARSLFGIVDLLAILPTYLTLVLPGGQALLAIRAIRLLRVFRVLKLAQYVSEAAVLVRALRASRHKITVFITAVVTLVVTLGAMMYLVEGSASGFTSIPVSVYWAIVTLTTVGYGDIAPRTPLGQGLATRRAGVARPVVQRQEHLPAGRGSRGMVLIPSRAYSGHQPTRPVTSGISPTRPHIVFGPRIVSDSSTRPRAILNTRSRPPTFPRGCDDMVLLLT